MSDNFQPPQSLMNGRYEIRDYLGKGAMALVYLGWDTRMRRQVAVKFLNNQVAEDPDNPDNPYMSFRREIDTLIALESCENVVRILDYDLDYDPQYIIMDYMAGGTAEDKKAEFLALPIHDRLMRVSQVLEEVIAALECSHQKSIVHRDIKPSNIFFDDKTHAYLGDFGIAKNLLYDSGFSQAGTILGPIKYMAPEAIEGDVTEQSDQYSLACVIYELLTGQQVFTADSLLELNELILKHPHTRINETQSGQEFSDAIANVMDKALSKQPQDRYPSVRKFGEAFKTAIRMSQLSKSPSSILNGRYKILEPIGSGGMGVVHVAHDQRVNQKVAIKFLSIPQNEKNSTELFDRFQDEIDALTKLNPYDYIVDILDYGNEGDVWFVIMEYMEGGDLYERMLDYLRMDIPERLLKVAQLVREISEALEKSHENGIIHRDIKLRNILFNRRGEAHLADFGIAKNIRSDAQRTQAGMIVGTINYMAPEAINGNVIELSDQYSLACAAYEVLTGQRAFDGTTVTRLIQTIAKDMPPRINETTYGRAYSDAIADVLEKALNKEPEDRYPTIRDFSEAFEEAVRLETGTIPPRPIATPLPVAPTDSETMLAPDTGGGKGTTDENSGTVVMATGQQERGTTNWGMSCGVIAVIAVVIAAIFLSFGGIGMVSGVTATDTETLTPTTIATDVPTATNTTMATVTDVATATNTPTATATNTPTATATNTPTATATDTATATATNTPTDIPTPTPKEISLCDVYLSLESTLSNSNLDCNLFHEVEAQISGDPALESAFASEIMDNLASECEGTTETLIIQPITAKGYQDDLSALGENLQCR